MTPSQQKEQTCVMILARGSVWIHVDPRRPGVTVPAQFRERPQLVLQWGWDFPNPIRDMTVDERGMRGWLSFQRVPHYVDISWEAIYAFVGDDGQVSVFPQDIPQELVPPAPGTGTDAPAPALSPPRRRAAFRLIRGGKE